jgi:hypothetical protein
MAAKKSLNPSEINSLFNLDYNYNQLNEISATLKDLAENNMIHGFGIYTKKTKESTIAEFVIVIKIKEGTGTNWMMMYYNTSKKYVYHRSDKKGNMGPRELYKYIQTNLGFIFDSPSNRPYAITDLNILIRDPDIVPPYWEGTDIEYIIGAYPKYGGSYNISRRKNKKRSYKKKQFY